MAVRARLLMSGWSQALRLPARFRFRGQEVEIEPMGQWLEAFYADHPPLPEAFLADRGDAPPQERDWS